MARPSKRQDIAEAALQVFHAHGYNGTGISDIAAAAAAPKGSFYNHFGSKQEAAVEALSRYAETLPFDALTTPGRPALGRLRTHFELMGQDVIRAGFARGCLVGNFGAEIADHSEEIRTALQKGLESWVEQVREVLAQAQEAGELNPELDARSIARMILGAWEGALILARIGKSAAPFDAFYYTVFEVLLR
jgi:TetR/AcrR family transcriptional repressor of nem operon